MIIIDGTDTIVGRTASIIAKRLLNGEEITIINAEKMIITGSKKDIFDKCKTRRERGHPATGPFQPRDADKMVRRSVRGMLPIKKSSGQAAYKRLKVYIGQPENVKGDTEKFEELHKDKLKNKKYMTILEITEWLGAKI
ncbi:MAG: 50S ribosomal protein L13 [DPANN group archaeon]|nr:50S ribosomal protein L13 [DPANN group archaeon]